MRVRVLQCAGAIALLALAQACAPDASLGYWEAGPASSAAKEADSATRDDAADGDRDESVSSGLAGASAPRAGSAAADSGVGVVGSSATLPRPDACQIARAGTPALEVTVSDVNTKLYDFADSAQFPAGNYRVTYVDGCRRFDGTGAWTLHASVLAAVLAPTRRGGAFMIMSGTQMLGLAPGTAGVIVGPGNEPNGAFATYEECVAANRGVAPIEFAFSGGTLGVMNTGDASPDSSTRGEDVGGRSPTFRLSRIDPCP